jgi:CheY-like chemotaxis protein
MEFKSLKQLPNSDANCQFLVVPIGFDAGMVERIKNIFKLERQADRIYRVDTHDTTDKIDVLLLNYDSPLSLHKKDRLLSTTRPHPLVVTVSQGPLTNPPEHHIRGMLTASRLLSVLDKLPLQNTPKPEPKPDVIIPLPHTILPKQEIPRPLPVLQKPDAAIVSANPVPATSTAGYRALVVDDSLAIQMSIKLKLENIKQITTIDFADNGESALEKSAATQYDLIFLDVMMPGMDGYETCTRLRKRAEYKKTPIIMVSGKNSPLDEVKGVMAGCTTYLTKPVEDQAFHKLSLRVLNWLADRRAIATT